MIKECPITINNEAVTVCMYDDVAIQFPSVHDTKKTFLMVEYKNGHYNIVEENAAPVEPETRAAKKGTKSEE